MATVTLVAYVGAAMSGRRTALRVSMGADASSHPTIDGGAVHALRSTTGEPLTAFVSSARSHAWYAPGHPPSDPRVHAEVALLKRADGIIFVWDVQAPRTPANREELAKLFGDLGDIRRPIVCLANKRDCPNQIEESVLKAHLSGIQVFNGVASNGTGCEEALAALLGLMRR